jgi:dTDP-4-dehydrorhamnose 3,5-epimerase
MIEGVIITPLSVLDTTGGDVLHGLKFSDLGYAGFGEAYFSTVEPHYIKGWKRHKEMVMNLIVPVGSIRFVIFDDRKGINNCKVQQVILARDGNYSRLTVPPMVWMGFQGIDNNTSILLNIASLEHSVDEVDIKELNAINFDWDIVK